MLNNIPVDKIIIVGGATASGKSAFACKIAKKLQSVTRKKAIIINSDSMQIYKGLSIITAQPSFQDMQEVEHRLYGFHSPCKHFSAGIWLDMVIPEIDNCLENNMIPILVGGTGMYIKSLTEGIAPIPDISPEIRRKTNDMLEEIGNEEFHNLLSEKDPIATEKISIGDRHRMSRAWEVIEQTGFSIYEWQKKTHKIFYDKSMFYGYFINPEREKLYYNCNKRFELMIEQGAIDEVKELMKVLANGRPSSHSQASEGKRESSALKALGVSEIIAHIKGDISLEQAILDARQSTRRYAKRQITFFKNQFPWLMEIT